MNDTTNKSQNKQLSKPLTLFGTDGIRGRVGVYPITPEFMLSLGWALGTVLREDKASGVSDTSGTSDAGTVDSGAVKVLIGKDTRISGYMFESALEAGLVAAGADIQLLGPMPTPAIAYLTRTLRAQAGLVISASHNPYHDNGIKFFSSQGEKFPDHMEQAIEAQLKKNIQCVPSDQLGRASRVVDAAGRYIEFCKSVLPGRTSLASKRIVVDCAQGATYHIAPKVFSELGAHVTALHNQPDGLNINEGCGSTDLQVLIETVLAQDADVGIALDGDGDRVMLVDNTGRVVDGDDILYILAKHGIIYGLKTGVVGTQMSNKGLENALEALDIPFQRVAVGDRHVLQALLAKNWYLGGEPSGHIICLDKNTCGDGIIAALRVLNIMQDTQASLSELLKDLHKLPQYSINVKKKGGINVSHCCTHPDVQKAVKQLEGRLGQQGRIIVRPSGTEPLIRIMVEGQDKDLIKQVGQSLAGVIGGLG